MENTPNIRTLTIREVSLLTNIPERKLHGLVRSGKLPKADIEGKLIRVYEVDVYNAFRPKTADEYRLNNN